jgi:L-cysteine/cystine lyase
VTPDEGRSLFPVLERLAYLNAGTFGPLARPTAAAVQEQLDADLADGRFGKEYFERMLELRKQARAVLGRLVGGEPGQVSLTGSTTDGCNIVLAGLELQPEDEIVTTSEEHFGLIGPVHTSGARVIVVEPDADAIAAAVTPRTKLLALSQVLWTSGRLLPVRELREQTGVPVLVDGAQSVGAIPVAAAGLDFLTVSGQKWLCGPDSTGALVVADPERLRVARPSYFSQTAHEPSGSFEPAEGAARFDPGWLSSAVLSGLLAAIEVRPDWAYEHAAGQAARCRELLARLVDVVPGGATLVAFRNDDPPALVAKLAEAGVVVREIPKTGLVRASCGWWTNEDDLQRLAKTVSEAVSETAGPRSSPL